MEKTKKEEKEKEEIIIKIVLSILICPFISYPEGFGVLDEGLIIPTNVRKTLVSISQTIDKLFNKKNLQGSLNVINQENSLLLRQDITIHLSLFLSNITKHFSSLSSLSPSKRFNLSQNSNLLDFQQDFHRFISFHLTPILHHTNSFFQENTTEGQKLFNLVRIIGPPYTPSNTTENKKEGSTGNSSSNHSNSNQNSNNKSSERDGSEKGGGEENQKNKDKISKKKTKEFEKNKK
eukprot:TRINITY_DN4145_c0_g1_i2.p1 TRINITY_DN4145_c0_g1~~TRINITY_DN4145_c0_g1_i2.p1  ORF type:complete len:273 (-),score=74.92 TRINITY_DN4145_c0_g1_i2:117-821(-)